MVSAKRAMRWWSSFLPVVFSIVFVSCSSVPATAPVITCTLIGCLGGITVNISGLPPGSDYEVTLILPSGEKTNLQCGDSPEVNPFENSCAESGAFFTLPSDVEPPGEITIEVIVGGVSTSQGFTPVYEKSQPNGEDCPPVCYNATVNFQFTQ